MTTLIVTNVSTVPVLAEYEDFVASTGASFPTSPTLQALAPFDAAPLTTLPYPDHHAFQAASLSSAPHLEHGEWYLGWKVTELPQPQKNALVNAERDRRLLAGSHFLPNGHSAPVHINSADESNLVGLAVTALSQVSLGNGSDTVTWIDNNGTSHVLTYVQVIELQSLAAQYKKDVFASAAALRDDPSGTPLSYQDDTHWPAYS